MNERKAFHRRYYWLVLQIENQTLSSPGSKQSGAAGFDYRSDSLHVFAVPSSGTCWENQAPRVCSFLLWEEAKGPTSALPSWESLLRP